VDTKIDILALIVAAAFYHPDKKLRGTLQDKLKKQFKIKKEIRDLLNNEKGTEIEPFRLTAEDIDCAVALGSIAFSGLGDQTRFRVVSKDTVGPNGGLVITSNLKSFYLKRYNKNRDGRPYGQPKEGWSFIPSFIPKNKEEYNTYLVPDKEGFTIKTKIPESPKSEFACLGAYRKADAIEGSNASLDKLGLKLEMENWEMSIRSGSPESTIRLIAYMSKNANLYLKGDDPEIADIKIRLDIPQEKKILLESTVSSTPSYCSWLCGKCSNELINKIDLSEKEIDEISKWLLPHKEWISY